MNLLYRCEDLAWAAGLFEGEGCLHFQQGRGVRAHLYSTDLDVVTRFARAIGFGKVVGPIYRRPISVRSFFRAPDGSPSRKPIWYWQISSFETVQALVALLWPWLGIRRRQQAASILIHGRAQRQAFYRRSIVYNTGADIQPVVPKARPRAHRSA